MQLEALVYFYEVAQGRTFMEVAESHNLSQSALSKSIKKLESELGFALLDRRNGRKVKLTPAGWQIMEDLDGISAYYEKLNSHIAMVNNNGRICVWLTLPGNILGVKSIIARFQKDHPEILLSVGQTRRNPRMVSGTEPSYENDCDMVVMHRPLGGSVDFVGDVLYEDAVVALIPRSHPLAQKPVLNFSDLKDYSVLVNFWGQAFLPEILQYTGAELGSVSLATQTREELVWRCIETQSIALFYASDMFMFQSRDIVIRLLQDLPMQPIVLVSPKKTKSRQVQVLHQYIVNAVKANPIGLTDCCNIQD